MANSNNINNSVNAQSGRVVDALDLYRIRIGDARKLPFLQALPHYDGLRRTLPLALRPGLIMVRDPCGPLPGDPQHYNWERARLVTDS